MECQVNHDWEGDLGLMVEIIDSTRYAADNPTLPPYVLPTQPLSRLSLPANPTTAHILTFTDKNKILNIDWSVLRGFFRGIRENIYDALEFEFFESLQHARYKYLKVLPQEYITKLKTNHCPIDVNKILELKT